MTPGKLFRARRTTPGLQLPKSLQSGSVHPLLGHWVSGGFKVGGLTGRLTQWGIL